MPLQNTRLSYEVIFNILRWYTKIPWQFATIIQLGNYGLFTADGVDYELLEQDITGIIEGPDTVLKGSRIYYKFLNL